MKQVAGEISKIVEAWVATARYYKLIVGMLIRVVLIV